MNGIAGLGATGLSHAITQQADERFAAADTDGNGAVSREEFSSALERNGVDTARIDKVFSRLDADGNGGISKSEQRMVLSEAARMLSDPQNHLMLIGGDPVSQILEELADNEGNTQRNQATDLYDQIAKL
jgi:Ca2+-binding EF-hand superfamily protein